jgi:hypothetical protein
MRFTRLILLLLSALLPITGEAADVPAPEYQIELLLFLRNATPSGENWPANPALPDPAKAVGSVLGAPPPLTDPGTPARSHLLVTPLPASSFQLSRHAEALRRDGLTPLLHVAWRQAVHERGNGDWLWLDAGPVRGLVRISLGRYLHIDTDLVQQTSGMEPAMIHSTDHRRMRSNKLHYLDQPGFGILVIIEPVEVAQPATTAFGPEPTITPVTSQ